MASSFKIKLKLPPNSAAGQPTSSNQNSPQRSSVPAEGSSIADGGSSAVSEDGAGEEMDELEDSPPPQNSASASPSSSRIKNGVVKAPSTSSNSGSVIKKARPIIPMGLPRPVDQMTIEEIEALPAAKRRKSLKARGAAGPGRGWRKGLKMDQKPVYVQPGSGAPVSKVATSTPSSFANPKVKSSLARDALSKTSTPLRSESPFSSGSPMPNDDLESRKEEEKKIPIPSTSSAPFRIYYRSTQPVHPLAKIPIGFAPITPLDKTKRSVRTWDKEVREIVTLTGKTWSALTWLTKQQSQSETDKENTTSTMEANIPSLSSNMPVRPSYMTINDDLTAPSTPGEAYNVPKSAAESTITSGQQNNPGSSPEVDWRGSTAAFTAANKR